MPHRLLEPYTGAYRTEVVNGKLYRTRVDEPDFRILQIPIDPDAPDAKIRLIRTLTRWLFLYRMCRMAALVIPVRKARGLDAAREKGRKLGMFVD